MARSRFVAFFAAPLLLPPLAVLLSACSTEADSYSESVENNFINGCEAELNDSPVYDNTQVASICKCSYEKIATYGEISFAEFENLDDELRENIDALAINVADTENISLLRRYLRACIVERLNS